MQPRGMDPDTWLAYHRRLHEQRRMRRWMFRLYAFLTLLALGAVIVIYYGRTP